jgi:hypothetical protein
VCSNRFVMGARVVETDRGWRPFENPIGAPP